MIPDSFDNMAVLFVGVGGQGVITAADVVTEAAFLEGMDVKQTEIHGLSRRFGSVSSQVHVGRETLSPLRGKGAVDLMVAMEAHEALRYLPYLKRSGTALINQLWIPTGVVPVSDHSLQDRPSLQNIDTNLVWLEATKKVQHNQFPQCLNIFMVGAASSFLPISMPSWQQAIRQCVPESHYTRNLEMFFFGQRFTSHQPSSVPEIHLQPQSLSIS
ncbi:MAG: indolepyruvate oxidoreductase subunit beta [Planctomycetota bacterium]|nr:indolepyruvate oxidoreductase subunit beta [Planctomycetota bacterium]